MRKFKGIISLCLAVLMLATLAGCGAKKEGLINAIEKSSNMKSYAFKGNINMSVNSEQLETQPNELGMDFSSMDILMEGKVQQEKDKYSKTEMNMSFGVMGVNVDMNILTDTVVEQDKVQFKMFMQIPEILKATTGPTFAEYDYFYFGSDTMEAMKKQMAEAGQEVPEYDMDEMVKNMTNLQTSFSKFINDYTKENGKEIIEDKGKLDVEVNGKPEKLQVYEMKIEFEGLKKLMKAYLKDENRVSELKSVLNSMSAANAVQGEEFDFDNIIQDIDNMPNFIGEDGIALSFAVKDGYIVQEKFNINIKVEEQGDIHYNFTMDIFDIESDINVNVPNKEEVKSIDLMELIQTMSMGM